MHALGERLKAHQEMTAEGEERLRRGLEDERRRVLGVVESAINEEWDGKVAVAVGEFRARAALEVERIVAEG